MPVAEKGGQIPTGQAYGQRAQQQQFLQNTKPAAPSPAPVVPDAATTLQPPQTQGDIVDAMLSPTDRPDEHPMTGAREVSDFSNDDVETVSQWAPVLDQLALSGNPTMRKLAAQANLFLQLHQGR